MENSWIALQSIPPTGRTVTLDNQALWETLLAEFSVPGRLAEPLQAEVTILPQAEGVLFRGSLKGTVILPCDRCSEDSLAVVDHRFDSFEGYPADPLLVDHVAAGDAEYPDDADEQVIRHAAHGRGIEVNPAALAWQEFSLSLPVKPLCRSDCKGLCPVCGKNKNSEECTCTVNAGDPRLAVLRGLHINKKK